MAVYFANLRADCDRLYDTALHGGATPLPVQLEEVERVASPGRDDLVQRLDKEIGSELAVVDRLHLRALEKSPLEEPVEPTQQEVERRPIGKTDSTKSWSRGDPVKSARRFSSLVS